MNSRLVLDVYVAVDDLKHITLLLLVPKLWDATFYVQNIGSETQSLVCAKQTLYQLNHMPSPTF